LPSALIFRKFISQQKPMLMKTTISLFSTLLLLFICFASCEDDKTEDKAPNLPPESAFVVPFDAFANANDTVSTSKSVYAGKTYRNWGTAFIQAGFWNIVINVGMLVPVTSFVEAFKHEPVYDVDTEKWKWSYNFLQHTAVLSGKLVGDSVQWEMQVSKANTYSDFVWYYGSSHKQGTGGYWILNESPSKNHQYLRIDWERDPSTETGNIKYTNIKVDGTENGGYIHYGSTTETDYNRYYNIYNKGDKNLTEIQWHHANKNGHIKNLKAFKDENWHCWGTDLADMECN